MQSHLRPWIVWYVVMYVLEEYSEWVFTGHQQMNAVCPDQNLCTHQSDDTVP
jgi:hypothetical protein